MAKRSASRSEAKTPDPDTEKTGRRARKPKIAAEPALHEVAFLMHLEEGHLAIPPNDWVEDPNSSQTVPTYGVQEGSPPCVGTNYHEVVRAGLAYIGRLQAAQCQQDPLAKREWVLARRRV